MWYFNHIDAVKIPLVWAALVGGPLESVTRLD